MSDKTDIIAKKESLSKVNRDIPVSTPPVDIYENDDEILLYADLPGVAKEDIIVNVDNGKLDITATRNMKSKGVPIWQEFGDIQYRRSFSVPQTINIAKVDAKLKNGVLKLHLPKSESAKPRIVEIMAA